MYRWAGWGGFSMIQGAVEVGNRPASGSITRLQALCLKSIVKYIDRRMKVGGTWKRGKRQTGCDESVDGE